MGERPSERSSPPPVGGVERGPTRRKTVVLTGASRGIGHATAKRFASAGWRVVTVARTPFPPSCGFSPAKADHVEADLADPAHFPEVVDAVVSRLDGTLDALVNNAGIAPKRPDGSRLGVLDAPVSVWNEVLCVNLLAPAALIRGLFTQLRGAGGSSVVNVTSIAGERYHPFAGAAYACSKAALTALTRDAATELGPFGIRVNAVSPGEIATTILTPGAEEVVGPRIPMGRLGTPEEVANIIFFLCSPEAGYVSGVDLPIDGAERAW